MAPALVAIEIAPPDAAPPLKQSLLDACGRSAEAPCVEAQGEQAEPSIVAIVSWQDPLHVRLEVALRHEQRWVVRAMAFAEQDAPEERWRAVGLVIGTLGTLIAQNKEPPGTEASHAVAPPGAAEGPGPVEPALPPLRSEPAPAVPPVEGTPDHVAPGESGTAPAGNEKHRDGWVGAALVVGSALDHGSPRMGAELDGQVHLGSSVYALVGFSYSAALARVDGVQTTFAEAFAGLLYAREVSKNYNAAFHVEALAERFSPSITSGDGGPTEGERWLGGARAGADVFYWGLEPIGFFLGAAAKWTAGATDVRRSGQYVGSAPTLGYVVRAGTAFDFR
jgi:hypothetical protein